MPTPSQAEFCNRLISLMTADDFTLLAPHLEYVEMPKHFVIAEADLPIDYAYFLESGLGSIVVASPERHETEAGIFGFDGLSPIGIVLGSDRSVAQIFMQVGGRGHRISRVTLTQILDGSASLRALLLRYAQVLNVQTTYTLLSNSVHQVDERLARWLLMCHDRNLGDDIHLTHDFLSLMLAVRRPSVTTSLHVLEGNRFIRSERGYITIRDRKALEEFAHDAYGKPEAEYLRLIGPMR